MTDTVTAQHHLEQAYSYENQEKIYEALRECDRAIQLNPDLADAHNLRGIILEQLGDSEEAIAAYQKAIQLQPTFEEAIQNRNVFSGAP